MKQALIARDLRRARPRRPTRVLVVAVDLDGTVFRQRDPSRRPPFHDPEALVASQDPVQAVVIRLLSLQDAGFQLVFTTGRKEHLRAVTIRELESLGFHAPVVYFHGVFDPLRLASRKAEVVRAHEAVLLVGDMDLDRMGAFQGGASFMWAWDFGAGHTLDDRFCWHCGATPLRPCGSHCRILGHRTCRCCLRPEGNLVVYQEAAP